MIFSMLDIQRVAHILEGAAETEIMPLFGRLPGDAVHAKTGPLDLVTVADEAAERAITHALKQAFPQALVIGEEAVSAHPELLAQLAGAELAFVIDPIDGTANYAAGLPLFGVMVAVLSKGRTVGGVIYDPVAKDHVMAVRGEGAWREGASFPRVRLRVAAPVPLAQMAGNVSWRFLPDMLKTRLLTNLPQIAAAWDYRCSAHQYRMLAAGHAHFQLYWRQMPWDHAAGVLIHEEAGGYAARFDGSPYDPLLHDGGLICATDRDSWLILRDTLLGPTPTA